jgi:hypothetical protein
MKPDADKALKDFLFEFGYSMGIIWIINRIPWLKLKPQYQTRLNTKLKNQNENHR